MAPGGLGPTWNTWPFLVLPMAGGRRGAFACVSALARIFGGWTGAWASGRSCHLNDPPQALLLQAQ